MFDIIFISYEEKNADENFERLLDVAPHAQRVHRVKGIAQAHIAASKLVSTSHFFTVDADNIVYEDFDWDRIIDFQKDDKRIHVWRALNSVNGLIYGYGGIKLWPTDHVENIKEYATDFTTSVATNGFKIQSSLASTTHFNTDTYSAWKSGYREGSKLASGMIHNADSRSLNRLIVWMSVGVDAKYGSECILGARMGALNAIGDDGHLHEINDFKRCKEIFDITPMYTKKYLENFGLNILEKELSRNIVLYDPDQSRVFKELMYGL